MCFFKNPLKMENIWKTFFLLPTFHSIIPFHLLLIHISRGRQGTAYTGSAASWLISSSPPLLFLNSLSSQENKNHTPYYLPTFLGNLNSLIVCFGFSCRPSRIWHLTPPPRKERALGDSPLYIFIYQTTSLQLYLFRPQLHTSGTHGSTQTDIREGAGT